MTFVSALRLPGFRKRSRDIVSDRSRLASIEWVFEVALLDIEREREGLGRRVDTLRAWVGGLLDSHDGSSSARHADAERDLVEAERQLLAGIKRLAELSALRDVLADLESRVADVARGIPS